jgi:hypothetical protein
MTYDDDEYTEQTTMRNIKEIIERYLPFLVFGAIAYFLQAYDIGNPQYYFLLGAIAGTVSVVNRK